MLMPQPVAPIAPLIDASINPSIDPSIDPSGIATSHGTWQEDLVRQSILILGSPRSGTSWLAKIVDSHPDVLFRHEPDEASGTRANPTAQLLAWAQPTGLRVVAKRPWFQKSWRPWPV